MKTKKVITICILFSLIALCIGFIIGLSTGITITIKQGVEVAKQFTNISVNEDLMRDAIFKYQSHLANAEEKYVTIRCI